MCHHLYINKNIVPLWEWTPVRHILEIPNVDEKIVICHLLSIQRNQGNSMYAIFIFMNCMFLLYLGQCGLPWMTFGGIPICPQGWQWKIWGLIYIFYIYSQTLFPKYLSEPWLWEYLPFTKRDESSRKGSEGLKSSSKEMKIKL
jgi:hypothetical protein